MTQKFKNFYFQMTSKIFLDIVGVVLFVCDNHYCMGDMEMEFAKIILTYTKRSINVSNRQTEIFS